MFRIATDYCVKNTAMDGVKLGFNVTVIEGLCRGVDPKTIENALQEMASSGVNVVKNLDDLKPR